MHYVAHVLHDNADSHVTRQNEPLKWPQLHKAAADEMTHIVARWVKLFYFITAWEAWVGGEFSIKGWEHKWS